MAGLLWFWGDGGRESGFVWLSPSGRSNYYPNGSVGSRTGAVELLRTLGMLQVTTFMTSGTSEDLV